MRYYHYAYLFLPARRYASAVRLTGWLRGTAVERRSVPGELSLSYAQPAADEWSLMWVNRPDKVSQVGQLNLSPFRGR